MDFFKLLQRAVGGANSVISNAIRGGQQAAGNVGHIGQQAAGNVGNIAQQPVRQAVRAVQPFIAQRPIIQPRQDSSPSMMPTAFPNILGGLAVGHAADNQGYSDFFRRLVMRTNPVVDDRLVGFGAGGQYDPNNNQIQLRSKQQDPYTVTHEGLHAAYETKTPEAQRQFQSLAQSGLDKANRAMITRKLGTSLYGNQRVGDIRNLPKQYATEVHSYAPEYGGNSQGLQQYYKRYFSDPNFNKEQMSDYKINNYVRPQKLTFTDQLGDY